MNVKNIKLPSETKLFNKIETASRSLSGFKIQKSSEEEGIIESVLVVNRVVYAVVRRSVDSYNETGHSSKGLFNNVRNIPEDNLSLFELLIPIYNIDLATSLIKPDELLGKYVMVSVLNKKAIKAEYIGELENFKQSPLKLLSAAITNARSLAGAGERLDKNTASRKFLQEKFNLTDDQLTLFEIPLKDVFGKTITIKDDAVYHKDTSKTTDKEVVIESHNLIRGTNQKSMKSRNCHLPVSIFSAR